MERPIVKLANLVLVVCLGLLTGCQTKKSDVTSGYYFLDGNRIDMIPENLLPSPEPVQDMVWVNAARVFRSMTAYDYVFQVEYAARAERGLLEISPGPNLTITVDGKPMRFVSGTGSLNTRQNEKGLVKETAIYSTTADDLRAIAAGKSVVVKVAGAKGSIERPFGPDNYKKFRMFVDRFVPRKW